MIRTLERRTKAKSRDTCCGRVRTPKACSSCRDGYATRSARDEVPPPGRCGRAFLAKVERRIADRDWRLMPGGRRLAGNRYHLDQAGLDVPEWRAQWTESRFFLARWGNAGMPGGNPCLTLHADGYLTVSVPKRVAEAFGVATRVRLTHPVRFTHRAGELTDRVTGRVATRLRHRAHDGARWRALVHPCVLEPRAGTDTALGCGAVGRCGRGGQQRRPPRRCCPRHPWQSGREPSPDPSRARRSAFEHP